MTKKCKKMIWLLIWIAIFLYPFISSFFGIDIGDTGIHYTNFKYLYKDTYIAGYSTVFTSIIGNMWWNIWGFLGVWCLNFLEVLIEWAISVMIYKWLRSYMDKLCISIGILLSVIACDCYLNIFNYHQFSVFLIIFCMIMLFYAITNEKICYSIVAGFAYILLVFAKFSSLPSIFIVFIIFINEKWTLRKKFIHCFCFIGGSLLSGIVLIMYLFKMNILSGWISSLSKMNEMANSSQSSYSIKNILDRLLWNNFATLATPLIMIGSGMVLAYSIYLLFVSNKYILFKLLLIVALLIICAYLCVYSFDVNPVGNSPQFTTGYNVMFGFCLFNGICSILWYLHQNNKELLYISIFSLFLPIFSTFASNTGTKHIIISMWIFLPLAMDNLRKMYIYCKKQGLYINNASIIAGVYILAFVAFKYCHMVYFTNNFETVNRMDISETIESGNFKFLHTTQREQNVLDGLYSYYKGINNTKQKLLVFGTGYGIYALLDADPFTRVNIIDTSYAGSQFEKDLENTNDKGFPLIIYCKTNQYFGYESSNYNYLIDLEKKNGHYGKKEILYNFIAKNNYSVEYENDYYIVYNNV